MICAECGDYEMSAFAMWMHYEGNHPDVPNPITTRLAFLGKFWCKLRGVKR